MTVIIELGALAVASAQRGDDHAADVLRSAAEMLIADKSAVDQLAALQRQDDARRLGQRDRTRRSRAGPRPPDVTRGNGESRDVTLQNVTPPSGFSPTPPFPNPPDSTTPHRGRARGGVGQNGQPDAEYAGLVEQLTTLLVDRLGPSWVDVDAFLKRRDYQTRGGWMKEVLTLLTGGQAIPEDVAQVCRDDAALTRPLGSPKALRTFVASAVEERVHPKTNNGARRGAGIGERAYRNTKAALEGL